MDFTVRCIEDIMPPADSRVPETSGSHSQQKAMLLPGYLRDNNADLVVSVSTAESTPSIQPGGTSLNGSVVLGGGFYTFDALTPTGSTPPPPAAWYLRPSRATTWTSGSISFWTRRSCDPKPSDAFKPRPMPRPSPWGSCAVQTTSAWRPSTSSTTKTD